MDLFYHCRRTFGVSQQNDIKRHLSILAKVRLPIKVWVAGRPRNFRLVAKSPTYFWHMIFLCYFLKGADKNVDVPLENAINAPL